jgi:hypothetical protein
MTSKGGKGCDLLIFASHTRYCQPRTNATKRPDLGDANYQRALITRSAFLLLLVKEGAAMRLRFNLILTMCLYLKLMIRRSAGFPESGI